MTGRNQFKKYKFVIKILIRFFSVFGKKINNLFLLFFRNSNGKLGLLLRYIFISNLAQKIGDNVSIQPGVYLFNLSNLSIGNNVSIHPMCYIEAAGGISIGDDVSIAHSTTLISTNHTWENIEVPIKYNCEEFSPILIENDVWIGCGVRILSGVKLSSRSIVAAGAVVNKDVLSNTIVGGVPAKLIKNI